ncbi:PREDICTED: uncharacterized protein LOC104808856 [Tarenaya hassleriana]|uniref:uncharacterized protein LOC104808856 n=1 Tax=Tarenaya hassleriana TaxID=28532 RepID=UPI00053C5F8E|nr:PREDICTED: uncharacterized protein LOC104808856 [Tarenaya hassleriana]
MASPLMRLTATANGGGGDAVYVAAVPLRAAVGPPQLVMSTAFSLNLWDFQHLMVLIKPSSPPSEVFVFDFQPRCPESVEAAMAVLSGKSVPGVVLQRTLRNLPRRKCWLVGSSKGNALDMAAVFNSSWETDLRVGYHDCRDYTNGLVEHLTGEKRVVEQLRTNNG